MMWVTWRQQRYTVSAVAILAVALTGWALKNGYQLHTLLHQYGAAPCNSGKGSAGSYENYCAVVVRRLSSAQSPRNFIAAFGLALPLILGIALGVGAIAGELDRKTARLAWTQSVSRTRWLMNKILVSLTLMLLILVPLSFVFSWWVHTSQYASRIAPTGFNEAGWMIAMIGVVSFALSLLLGLYVRSVGWAASAAVLLLLILFYLMSSDVRPHLVPISETSITSTSVTSGSSTYSFEVLGAPGNSWLLFQGIIPARSNSLPPSSQATQRLDTLFNRCQNAVNASVSNSATYCLGRLGLKDVALYVADDEFWNLQLREGGLYLALAGLFVGLSAYGITRVDV